MDVEMPADDEEEFIFVIVRMPVEFALSLGELDVVLVQFADEFNFVNFSARFTLLIDLSKFPDADRMADFCKIGN
jgi:hypothetical protein